MKQKMRIHFLVAAADGPVASAATVLNFAGAVMPLGTDQRYRAACDGSIVMGRLDRGTSEPWAVRCHACQESEAFRKANRPKPPSLQDSGDLLADGKP